MRETLCRKGRGNGVRNSSKHPPGRHCLLLLTDRGYCQNHDSNCAGELSSSSLCTSNQYRDAKLERRAMSND